jgi:hypothetical protein
VAGHVSLELRNACASHVFEMPWSFPLARPKRATRDYSPLSCGRPNRGIWRCTERRGVRFCAEELDLGLALFRQLLHAMLLVIGDCRRKRHGARHPNMSEGDEECFLFIQPDDVAHDATFVACIRQVRDDAAYLVCVGNIFGLKLFDHRWLASSRLRMAQQP